MGLTVLIVDDSSRTRAEVSEFLIQLGHHPVAQAENGMQAIDQFVRYRPRLVTLDLVMPELDGAAALEELVKIRKDFKVIIVSSSVQSSLANQARDAGATVFVEKPVTLEKLRAALEEIDRLEGVA